MNSDAFSDFDLGQTVRGFAPGQRVFKRYTLERLLGRGGMGVVWLARDEKLEQAVALKFLPELLAADDDAVADLKRETRRNLALTHPHIVRIHDFVSDDHLAAISMEWVDGEALSARRGALPQRCFDAATLAPWMEQACAALDYAHRRAKVVHRDLKPANLMVDREDQLKILDFGIAASISSSASRVSNRGTSGTLAYMSPQQLLGKDAKAADDVYALGATLYDLLTGKPPFHSGDLTTQIREIVPVPVNTRRAARDLPTVPAAWDETIAACLAKEPGERPASAAEVAERLRGEGRPAAATGSQSPEARGQPIPLGSPPADKSEEPSGPDAGETAPSALRPGDMVAAAVSVLVLFLIIAYQLAGPGK